MNSDDLRFFLTISQSDTLAMAARSLDVTPPNITQRLQSLEKKMGVTLIKRPSRRVCLTDEGWMIFEKAKKIIESLDDLSRHLDERRGVVSGKLNILAPLGYGADYIAPLISDFKKYHPSLEIELSLSDIPSWTSFHEWDIVIYIGELKDSSMSCIKLSENKRYLCASPQYISLHGMPSNPTELSRHHCIVLRENDEDVTLWKFTHRQEKVSVRIQPYLSTNNGKTVKQWGLKGDGIFIRSDWDIKEDIAKGNLIHLLPDYKLPNADIVALTSYANSSRPPRIQLFLDFLKVNLQVF